MTYTEFNERILTFYLSRARSTFLNLSIDKYDLTDIIGIDQIHKFPELQDNWNDLLKSDRAIPAYIGLLAVQCLAASEMQDADGLSDKAYRIRLQQLLKLPDQETLKGLFQGTSYHLCCQDNLWATAADYFKSQYDLKLTLPPQNTGPWRYVRYPLLQALLNKEELKDFTPLFAQEFLPRETISVAYFNERMFANLSNIIKLSAKTKKLFLDEITKSLVIQQLYNFYSDWDGSVYRISSAAKGPTSRHFESKIEPLTVKLTLQDNQPSFYLKENDDQPIKPETLFQIPGYKYRRDDILLFTPVEYYDEEFEDSKFLYTGIASCVLVKIKLYPKIIAYFLNNNIPYMAVAQDIFLFQWTPSSNFEETPLSQFIQRPHPVSLKGGIKIDRSRTYLLGWGPSLDCLIPFRIFYYNNKIDYHPQKGSCGSYKVRVDGFNDVSFEITENTMLRTAILSKGKGWNLHNFAPSEDYNLEGAILNIPADDSGSPMIHWLKLQRPYQNRFKKDSYKGTNILLKALNQAKI